jgi:hypothetical protein
VEHQKEIHAAKIRFKHGRGLFLKLSSPVFSLIWGFSLVAVMAVGLIGSYKDRLSPTSEESFSPGVSYSISSREKSRKISSALSEQKTMVSPSIAVEGLNNKPVLAKGTASKSLRLVLSQVEPGLDQVDSLALNNQVIDHSAAVADDHELLYGEAAPSVVPFDSLLKQRIGAGQSLLSLSEGGYSIQLMLVSHETIGNMDEFIKDNGLENYADDLYLFPLEGKKYLIYYGRFDFIKTAKVALAQLPDSMKKSGAYVIPLRRIRTKTAKQQPKHRFVKSQYL